MKKSSYSGKLFNILFILVFLIFLAFLVQINVIDGLIFDKEYGIIDNEESEEIHTEPKKIVYIQEDIEYDKEGSIMTILNSMVEKNNTMYYIRNELLYRNSYLNHDRANLKTAIIYENCIAEGIDPWLIVAIGIVESDLSHVNNSQEVIRSNAGAVGMFQLTPIVEGIYDVNGLVFEENVMGAVKFIRDLWDDYSDYDSYYDQIELVLAHYNGGSRPEYAIENYRETRNFVPEVLEIYEILIDRYE